MVLKFQTDIYYDEHFARLHMRYYSLAYPFFLIAMGVSCHTIKLTGKRKMFMWGFTTSAAVATFVYFGPRYITVGLTIVDNPEMAWYIFASKVSKLLVAAGIILLATYYALQHSLTLKPFFLCFTLWAAFANVGEIRNSIYFDCLITGELKSYKEFIVGNIPNINSSVALLTTKPQARFQIPFWYPYNYTSVQILPNGSRISATMIPAATDYLVLVGKFVVDFRTGKSVANNICTILPWKGQLW
jgi:hypothetical protein